MNYGERLKELRLSRDLKQSDLADILGVSSSAIGTYERCERQPTYELLHQYAKYFNVSIDYILCLSDEKFTTEQYQRLTTIDLSYMLHKHSVTLAGVELTAADKQRVLDVVTVLLFDRIK